MTSTQQTTTFTYTVTRDDEWGQSEYHIECSFGTRRIILYVTAQGVTYPSMAPCPPEYCRYMAEVLLLGARLSESLAAEAAALANGVQS